MSDTIVDTVEIHIDLMAKSEAFRALSEQFDRSTIQLQEAAGNVWDRSGDIRLPPFRCVNGQKSAMMEWHLSFSHLTNKIAFAETKESLATAFDVAVGMSLSLSMLLEEHSRFGLTREQADRYCDAKRLVLSNAHSVALARFEEMKGGSR